jgi:hypothetical protein
MKSRIVDPLLMVLPRTRVEFPVNTDLIADQARAAAELGERSILVKPLKRGRVGGRRTRGAAVAA